MNRHTASRHNVSLAFWNRSIGSSLSDSSMVCSHVCSIRVLKRQNYSQ